MTSAIAHGACPAGMLVHLGVMQWVAPTGALFWHNVQRGRAMWLLVAREAPPDAPYWPGRHLLAAVDAVVWPLFWVMVFSAAPAPTGVVGPFVSALALLAGLGRLHRALWCNHRYRFTTWRWGRVVAGLLLVGFVMKVMLVV